MINAFVGFIDRTTLHEGVATRSIPLWWPFARIFLSFFFKKTVALNVLLPKEQKSSRKRSQKIIKFNFDILTAQNGY